MTKLSQCLSSRQSRGETSAEDGACSNGCTRQSVYRCDDDDLRSKSVNRLHGSCNFRIRARHMQSLSSGNLRLTILQMKRYRMRLAPSGRKSSLFPMNEVSRYRRLFVGRQLVSFLTARIAGLGTGASFFGFSICGCDCMSDRLWQRCRNDTMRQACAQGSAGWPFFLYFLFSTQTATDNFVRTDRACRMRRVAGCLYLSALKTHVTNTSSCRLVSANSTRALLPIVLHYKFFFFIVALAYTKV
jgi:hypothetical protein